MIGALSTVQHLGVKIFARQPEGIDLAPAIPVFHRWIQEQNFDGLLFDVADYRHVPAGPGVMLIAHEGNYSLDQAHHRLGLFYSSKLKSDLTPEDQLRACLQRAATACLRLESEPEFTGRLRFEAGHCDLVINDRLLAPNTEVTAKRWTPLFNSVFAAAYGEGDYKISRREDPRERFNLQIRSSRPLDCSSMLSLLSGWAS